MKTIRILSTLALGLFFLAGSASAQIPYVGQLQFGVKAGINTAWITGEGFDPQLEEGSPRLGAAAGLAARYHIGPSLAFQAEAQYSQKGQKYEDGANDATVKLDYIEIPVLVRYAVPLSPLMTTGIYAGPSVGFPINSEIDVEGDPTSLDDVATDFGLNVGIDVGSGPFYVDGRYNLGLTSIGDEGDAKNQHVQFTFGYWF